MKNQTFSPSTEPTQPPKRSFKFLFIAALILFVISLFLIFGNKQSQEPKESPTQTPQALAGGTIESLLYSQLPQVLSERGKESWTLDDINFSDDKSQAFLWMAANDLTTGELLAREPHIILAAWDETSGQWLMHFEEDDDFVHIFESSAFKDSELAERFFESDPKAPISVETYGGFYLPWRAGLSKRLTWSVGHNSCASGYCTYAFDFADGTMFQVLATKSGYVYHWKDTCNNGNSSCTNSITIQDRSTTPWTYHIYLHIAKGSIPFALKEKGVRVLRGQTIAYADDTGYSTGNHVHFMVVEQTTLNSCANYCWGRSVDITFRDVTINWDAATQGGRPRLPDEASWYGGEGQTSYVSGNVYNRGPYRYIMFPIFK
ncbi:MAG: M23 family metallopeptidase [Anaerolineaceae bacterium]